METGIIGAGQVGSVLARRFKAVGHDVFIAKLTQPRHARNPRCGDRSTSCHESGLMPAVSRATYDQRRSSCNSTNT
jgi:prephenate dehydrogenase